MEESQEKNSTGSVIPEKFTFFWNGPFSQWHLCMIVVDGVEYNCAEQYMMVMKANLFGDEHSAKRIMKVYSPREQKSLGRRVQGFDKERWNTVSRDIVYRGSLCKFIQNPDLCKLLFATDGTTLVEASPYDRIWGIGLLATDPRAQSRETWLGTNWLGEALTKVREQLMFESTMDALVAGMGRGEKIDD